MAEEAARESLSTSLLNAGAHSQPLPMALLNPALFLNPGRLVCAVPGAHSQELLSQPRGGMILIRGSLWPELLPGSRSHSGESGQEGERGQEWRWGGRRDVEKCAGILSPAEISPQNE